MHSRDKIVLSSSTAKENLRCGTSKTLKSDTESYFQTPEGMRYLERVISKTFDETERADYERALRQGRERRQAAWDAYLAATTPDQRVADAREVIDARTSSPEFMALLEERDSAMREMVDTKAKSEEIRELIRSDQGGHNFTFQDVQDLNTQHRLADARVRKAKDALEVYKDETAEFAVLVQENAELFDVEYQGEHLGIDDNCDKVATYESGTREWLEQRQHGIGGSDIGSILKMHGVFSTKQYQEFFDSKVEPISDEQVREQSVTNKYKGASGRGNAWEPLIVERFGREHPEFTTVFTKSTWLNRNDPRMSINVDGLLSTDGGKTVEGILEIKTASDASKWGKDVPMSYRAQVMYYLRATGFSYAFVAVLIDDHEYRDYYISAHETIEGAWETEKKPGMTLEQYMPKIDAAWKSVQKAKEEKARNEELLARGEDIPEKPQKSLKQPFSFNSNNAFEAGILRAATFRQENVEDTLRRYRELDSLHGSQGAMYTLYREFDFKNAEKDIVFIDLETDAMTYRTGEIIEFGAARYRPDGTLVSTFSQLYGVSDEALLDVRGTGAEDVHHISPDMIRGLKPFSDPENQQAIRELMDGAIPSYHNATFENSWLSQHLEGFADDSGNPPGCIDTMDIAKRLDPKGVRNTLEDFVTARGMEYRNAHRAFEDAKMSGEAFFAWMKEFYAGELD